MSRAARTIVVLTALLATAQLGAQVTETPIAFDSAGRVRTLTPPLVARLELRAPAWPVEGGFREARLFALSSGGRVLAVERLAGGVDRYSLSDEAIAALQAAVDAGLTRVGRVMTEERSDVVSEQAGGAFTRNQMFATWVIYGPALASLTESESVFLLATGASYFITSNIGRKEQVTRAQNHLTSDAAYRGYLFGTWALYVIAGDAPSDKTRAAVGLASALSTAVVGFRTGRGFTDAEAESRTTISSLAAATTFLALGAADALGDDVAPRAVIGAMAATLAAGYVVGPRYARQPSFAVTTGDVRLLRLSSQLGVMIALTPFVDADASAQAVFGAATVGLAGGAWFGHARLVRRYNYSTSQAGQVTLGALAGGVLGGGTAALVGAESGQFIMVLITGGAVLGAVAGHKFADPARVGAPSAGTPPAARQGAQLEFQPHGLALALAGVPGRYTVLRVRF